MNPWMLGALSMLCLLASARGGPEFAELDRYIEQQMQIGKIPGLGAAVIKNDQILWEGHYGSTLPNITNGPKVDNTTVFMYASVSKTIIGMSAMVLWEKGLLTPDDDVNIHLPFELRNPHFPSVPITIHGLLTHTSSIQDDRYDDLPGSELYFDGPSPMNLTMFMDALLKKDGKWYAMETFNKKHAPGVHFSYCNICSVLAAYIVERIAIKHNFAISYDDFARKHVLAPLGVTNAGYWNKDADVAPPGGAIPSMWNHHKKKYDTYCLYSSPDYPDGSYKSSALDYARIFGTFINNGTFQGVQLLTPETVTYMKTLVSKPCLPQPCGDAGEPQGNVFFYFEKQNHRTLMGHNGEDMGIATEAFYNVATGVGFIVLTNGDWGSTDEYADSFMNIENKLLDTFDTDAAPEALEIPDFPFHRTRRPRHKSSSSETKCPCGTPCGSSGFYI